MIIDLADFIVEAEAADPTGGPDAEAYRRNARLPLADFECAHGRLVPDEPCSECER